MSRELIIRADGGHALGLGHVLRSVSLAEEANRRGTAATFITSTHSGVADLLGSRGYEAREVDFGAPGLDEIEAGAFVFIDGDHFGPEVYAGARERAGVVAAISDRGRGRFDADVLVSPDSRDGGAYTVPSASVVLTGPEHALVRSEFMRRRRVRGEVSESRGVVVSLGGSDAYGMSAEVARAVRQATDGRVRLLLGPLTQCQSVPGVERVAPTIEPSLLFDDADLVVSAAGSTAWELLTMGQACVLLSLNPSQRRVCDLIAAEDAALVVWDAEDWPAEVAAAVAALAAPSDRARLSRSAMRLVDGRGSRRVLDAMERKSCE